MHHFFVIAAILVLAAGCDTTSDPLSNVPKPTQTQDAPDDEAAMKVWNRLLRAFRHEPAHWEFLDGDETEGPYVHSTAVLAMSFSPDDSLLAIAGGGFIPGTDATIRLIDPVTRRNVRTLVAHVCGIHDLSFDRETRILASASQDYSVCLWNLSTEDVIFLLGEQGKVKLNSQFTRVGSLLAVGEFDYYSGPHSLYIYDLIKSRMIFRHSPTNEQGIRAISVSAHSRFIAFAAGDQNDTHPSRVGVFDTIGCRIVMNREFDEFSVYHVACVGDDAVLAANYEAGIALLEIDSGAIRWREELDGINVLATHPLEECIAVGFDSPRLCFYSPTDWSLLGRHDIEGCSEDEIVTSLAFTNDGEKLAYGTSSGRFDITDSIK